MNDRLIEHSINQKNRNIAAPCPPLRVGSRSFYVKTIPNGGCAGTEKCPKVTRCSGFRRKALRTPPTDAGFVVRGCRVYAWRFTAVLGCHGASGKGGQAGWVRCAVLVDQDSGRISANRTEY